MALQLEYKVKGESEMRRLVLRAMKCIPLLAAVLLLLAVPAKAAPELEALPLAEPSAEMMAMAAAQATSGPTFFYVVTSVDSIGRQSVFSNEASGTLLATSTSITLAWTVPTSSVAGYNVFRSPTTGGPYKQINAALVSGVTSFTDPFPLPPVVSGLTAKPN